MIKKIKNFLTTISASVLFLVPVTAPAVVYAADEITGPLCSGANLEFELDSSSAECEQDAPTQKVQDLIKLVINVFSLVVGIVAVIMIIYGGLKYITSGGEGSNISAAKNTILYAIIGLVVVALAQIIVRFVLSRTIST